MKVTPIYEPVGMRGCANRGQHPAFGGGTIYRSPACLIEVPGVGEFYLCRQCAGQMAASIQVAITTKATYQARQKALKDAEAKARKAAKAG